MATGERILQDGAAGDPFAPRPHPARTRRTVAVLVVLFLVLAEVVYTFHQAGGYYAISPGSAPLVSDQPGCRTSGVGAFVLDGRPCIRLVLPAGRAARSQGSILMVDVLLGKATAWDYFLQQVHLLHQLDDGTVLYPAAAILGSTPASQLGCQDSQQMTAATQQAEVVALRRLGYQVGEHDLGAQIDQVGANTPAAAAGMACNDLVTQFDGHPVATAADLVDAVHASAPGSPFHAQVTRVQGAKTATVQISGRLTATPAAPARPFLGITSETRSTYQYPFDVGVQVGQIGGPSAGLAITLGLIDSLSGGQLTGGHRIAATGTIDLAGNVGDVGGVAQKTVAVKRAGAEIFFVPVPDEAAARSEAGSLKVYPVATVAQAIGILEGLGGRIPAPPPVSG